MLIVSACVIESAVFIVSACAIVSAVLISRQIAPIAQCKYEETVRLLMNIFDTTARQYENAMQANSARDVQLCESESGSVHAARGGARTYSCLRHVFTPCNSVWPAIMSPCYVPHCNALPSFSSTLRTSSWVYTMRSIILLLLVCDVL